MTDTAHPTFKQSLMNLRKNIVIVTALLGLVVVNFAFNVPHYEMLWAVVIVLVIKAEARPQPTAVLLLSMVVAISAITATLDYRGIGVYFDWITIALLIPLVFSKWLFPHSHQP